MQNEREQSDYYTASEEDNTDIESDEKMEGQPRRSRRIQSQSETDEKVVRALKKLNMSYNPIMSGMAFSDEVAMVGGTDESYDNPDQFEEAWNHPVQRKESIGGKLLRRNSII